MVVTVLFAVTLLTACQPFPSGNPELTAKTRLELVDWHITGLLIINCPTAWVRVGNFNSVPIKNITFQYNTFDENGQAMDEGTFTIEDSVKPGQTKNFIELYLGLVDLHTERLSVKLLSVEPY